MSLITYVTTMSCKSVRSRRFKPFDCGYVRMRNKPLKNYQMKLRRFIFYKAQAKLRKIEKGWSFCNHILYRIFLLMYYWYFAYWLTCLLHITSILDMFFCGLHSSHAMYNLIPTPGFGGPLRLTWVLRVDFSSLLINGLSKCSSKWSTYQLFHSVRILVMIAELLISDYVRKITLSILISWLNNLSKNFVFKH